jgi:hypothetical protein
MVIHESLKTTIIDSVIPLDLAPTQLEALQTTTQYLYLAQEAIQALKSGNLKSFTASKGFPFNPNIPLITLRFFEIEKSKNFEELEELSQWLVKIRKQTEKLLSCEEKAYKSREGLSTFLDRFLPPLNLCLNIRLLINIHILDQLNLNLSFLPFPERFKRKIPGTLQRKIGSYCLHFMQAACTQKHSPTVERMLIQHKSIRHINNIPYPPFFLNVQVVLKKAKEENQVVALFINGLQRGLFKPNEEGSFQPIDSATLKPDQGVLAFYLRSTKNDFSSLTPEDLLLPAAAMMPQYPAEPARAQKGIPLFTEKPEAEWLDKIRKLRFNSVSHSFQQLSDTYFRQISEEEQNEWKTASCGRYELHELAEAYDHILQMRKKWSDQGANLAILSCEVHFAESLYTLPSQTN